MASFQTFVAMGNLTKDPDVRQVGDKSVAKFSIAINGFKEGDVLFLDCEWWRAGAILGYMAKGTPVLIEGSLKMDRWEKDGQKRERMICVINRLQLVGGKKREEPVQEEFAAF
jgi:single-strand DNA-binding protein